MDGRYAATGGGCMSHRAVGWAYRMRLPITPKFVLVTLADLADEADSCWPSQKWIAEQVGASPRTVRDALAALEGGGYIVREPRPIVGGGRRSDRYVLQLDRDPD